MRPYQANFKSLLLHELTEPGDSFLSFAMYPSAKAIVSLSWTAGVNPASPTKDLNLSDGFVPDILSKTCQIKGSKQMQDQFSSLPISITHELPVLDSAAAAG